MKLFLAWIKRNPILKVIIVVVALVLAISIPVAVSGTTISTVSPLSALANIGGGGGAGQVAFFTDSSNIGSDSNLTWDNTNKRLGIGTATPSRLLHVKGNVCLFERSSNSAGFIIERNGGDVTGYNRWVFGVDEPTGFVIKTYPYDGAAAVPQLVITKDNPSTSYNESRVGINTTTPGARLEVDETSSTGTAVKGQNTGSGNFGCLGGSSSGGYGVYGQSGVSGGTGVWGSSTSSSGYGVFGSSNNSVGVYGKNETSTNYGELGTNGYGVFGHNNGDSPGVYGESSSGNGVVGHSSSGDGVVGTGPDAGVTGSSSGGYGVSGYSTGYDGIYGTTTISSHAGVHGNNSTSGAGVLGSSTTGNGVAGTSSGAASGVYGTNNSTGNGVYGSNSSTGNGVYGTSDSGTGVSGASTSGYGLYGYSYSGYAGYFFGKVRVTGDFSVGGTKNFVTADPTDPTKEIYYAALEGPEAGTYFRGSSELVNGKATIELPANFAEVTADKGLTVQLTCVGKWLQLYVVEKSTRRIVVGEATGQSGNFDYVINGVRKGYEDYQVIREATPVVQEANLPK